MKKLVLLICLVCLLAACGGSEKQKVMVNDKQITVTLRSLSIVCDKEKEIGLAYFESDTRDGYAGILVGEYYDKFCGDVK